MKIKVEKSMQLKACCLFNSTIDILIYSPDDVILQIALMHIGSCILKLPFEMLTPDGCLLIVMAFNCPIII
jgi:hypothetical protein